MQDFDIFNLQSGFLFFISLIISGKRIRNSIYFIQIIIDLGMILKQFFSLTNLSKAEIFYIYKVAQIFIVYKN